LILKLLIFSIPFFAFVQPSLGKVVDQPALEDSLYGTPEASLAPTPSFAILESPDSGEICEVRLASSAQDLLPLMFKGMGPARSQETTLGLTACSEYEVALASELAGTLESEARVAMLPLLAAIVIGTCPRAFVVGAAIGGATDLLLDSEIPSEGLSGSQGGLKGLSTGLDVSRASDASGSARLKAITVGKVKYRPHWISRLNGLAGGGLLGVSCGLLGDFTGKAISHRIHYIF